MTQTDIAIVVIPGYGQGIQPGTGPALIYDHLYEQFDSRREALLLFRSWKSSPHETARLINSKRPRKLAVIAYSYGCGWGLPRLAKALVPFAIKISMAVLLDPVPRYRILKPISLTRLARYKVPRDISLVHTSRQCNAGPYGRQLKIHAGTRIGEQTVYGSEDDLIRYGGPGHHVVDDDIDHQSLDNDPRVRDDVLRLIKEWADG